MKRVLHSLAIATLTVATSISTAWGATLPSHREEYATSKIGGGRECKVGIARDADGTRAKGLVYVDDGNTPVWAATLKLPEFTEQARATHCVQSGNSIYVLVQGDTSTSPSLGQTLLNVAQLDAATGKVQGMQYVDLAEVNGSVSMSADADARHFRVTSPQSIEITGKYVLTEAPDAPHDFKVTVKIPLAD